MKKNSKNEYLYTRGALVHLCDYNGTDVYAYIHKGPLVYTPHLDYP